MKEDSHSAAIAAELKNKLTYPRIVLEAARDGRASVHHLHRAIEFLDQAIRVIDPSYQPSSMGASPMP